MAEAPASSSGGGEDPPRWDEELCCPVNKIAKVMKKALPSNGKLSKNGKELVQQCISEFISYITGEASARCQREKRMTMNGEDVIWAMAKLGFDDYVEPLKLYLFKYRQYVNCNEIPVGMQDSQFFAGISASVRGTPAGEGLVIEEMEGRGLTCHSEAEQEQDGNTAMEDSTKNGFLTEEDSSLKGGVPQENTSMEADSVKQGPSSEENSDSKKQPAKTRKRGTPLEEGL